MERLRRCCAGRDALAASLATALVGLTLEIPLVWLAHRRTALLADPQGVIATAKAWFADRADEVASFAGGLGKSLAKAALALMTLFFFYRDSVHLVSELRHVLAL